MTKTILPAIPLPASIISTRTPSSRTGVDVELENGAFPLIAPLIRRLQNLRRLGGKPEFIGDEFRLACVPLGIVPPVDEPSWFREFLDKLAPRLLPHNNSFTQSDAEVIKGEVLSKVPTEQWDMANRILLACDAVVAFYDGRADRGLLQPKTKATDGYLQCGHDIWRSQQPINGRWEIQFANEWFDLDDFQFKLLRDTCTEDDDHHDVGSSRETVHFGRTLEADETIVFDRADGKLADSSPTSLDDSCSAQEEPSKLEISSYESLNREIEQLKQEQLKSSIAIKDLQQSSRQVAALVQRLLYLIEATTPELKKVGSQIGRNDGSSADSGLRNSTNESWTDHVEGSFADPLVAIIDGVGERMGKLEASISSLDSNASPIRSELPEFQRAILQSILALPPNAFENAEDLIGEIVGLPMSEAFCKSLRAVLLAKDWGLICHTCGKVSNLHWNSNPNYAEGGRGQFSHSAPTPHGSLTRIRKFKFARKPSVKD